MQINRDTMDAAVQDAIVHHQAGRLAEAEAIYRRVLTIEPRHADALHFLGLAAYHAASYEPAIKLIRDSMQIRPGNAVYHSNLGEVLRAAGQHETDGMDLKKVSVCGKQTRKK